MYGLSVYITPEDIIDRLSDEDKERFNQCVFTDVTKGRDGSITIDCIVFDDQDPYVRAKHRQKYFNNGVISCSADNEQKVVPPSGKVLPQAAKSGDIFLLEY